MYFCYDSNEIYVGTTAYTTDTKVTQGAVPSSGTFDLLLAKTSNSHTEETSTVNKSGANLAYNVVTHVLTIGGNEALTTWTVV